MADEWDELEKGGGWVDTGEPSAPAEAEEAAPAEEAPAPAGAEEAAPSGGDEWDELEKGGGWVDTGEEVEAAPTLEKVKVAVAPKAKPAAPPEVKKGFFQKYFAGDSWGIGLVLVVILLAGITWIAISSNNIGLTGLVVGVLVGFAFQKGRFCIYMAHRDILLMNSYGMMKALILCMILIMVGYLLVSNDGLGILSSATDGEFTEIAPRPFIWAAILIGGFIFGIGTVLAGGCAAGTTYRAGEGYIGNMIAVVTLMLGASLGMFGALSPFVGDLKKTVGEYTTVSGETISNPTVFHVMENMGISHWLTAIGIIILVAVIWIWKCGFKLQGIIPKGGISLEKIVKRKWTKWKAGVAIAVIVVIGLLAHATAQACCGQGHNYSICAACGLVRLTQNYFSTNGNLFEWSGLMMVGLVAGAFISAQFAGEFALRVPEGKIILQVALGGFLMGLGAVMALGCTVGHILSGVPTLSLGSLLGWVSIAAGIWITAYMLFVRE